jgi:hypothetical protein
MPERESNFLPSLEKNKSNQLITNKQKKIIAIIIQQ